MIYLLDTNVCIQYMRGRSQALMTKILTVRESDIGISTITCAELEYGSSRSQNPTITRRKQNDFLARFQIVDFDRRAAEFYGDARATLSMAGLEIGKLDMLIAAIALANDLTLVTHNTREFSRVEGLRLEDWEI